jgi:D-3-phosphoglycerate dehydrogenase
VSQGRVFIADDFHPVLLQMLDEESVPYDYQPQATREDIFQALQAGAVGLILRSKTQADKELIAQGAGLKFIGRGGAGMDNIDEEAAAASGVICFNAGEANSDAVGEHTLGMLLSLMHKIVKADKEVRQGIWQREENRGLELSGKTVGIIGFGNTGSAVAKKLSGFNVKVLAYDKYKSGFSNEWVQEVSEAEIFENVDILTLHIPLDGHTKNMVNTEYLQRFVRKIYLLNASRGKIVNTKSVVEFLNSGKLLGFAADVLEHENPLQMGDTEKLWFEALCQKDNVVLTPHVAGWTVESYEKIAGVLASKICDRWPWE